MISHPQDTPAQCALRVRGLAVQFGNTPGLHAVSFDVARGERVVLLGQSGAGKTTLLRAIAGLKSIDSGTVKIGGEDRTDMPPERRDAVYLHQTPLLFPHLDVFGNIAFPLRVRGVRPTDVRVRVARALAAVRLSGFESRRPSGLSGGQRHRVALARAIVAQPALLLLDEPLSSLDPALRDEVRDAIVQAQVESGAGMVLVTHDLDEAGLIGHRIGVILDRSVAQIASPATLFAHPRSLAIARLVGIGNEITGSIDARNVFVSAIGPIQLENHQTARGPATIAFRPDAVTVVSDSVVSATVLQLRHRAERTTALVQANGISFEVLVDSLCAPSVGDNVALAFDARRLVIFPER